MNIDEFKIYTQKLTYEQICECLENVDKVQYPENYKVLLDAKNTSESNGFKVSKPGVIQTKKDLIPKWFGDLLEDLY